MKKFFVFSLVIIIAAMSVIAVSAAPRGGYYDQIGNKYWCNSDSYGCWVTGEDGGHEYIMFWSEAAATAIMGPNSGAPVGTLPGTNTLNLAAPVAEAAAAAEKKDSDGGGEKKLCGGKECASDEECVNDVCTKKTDGGGKTGCTSDSECATGQTCNTESGECENGTQITCTDEQQQACQDEDGNQCSLDAQCNCTC